jgi:hypothetical protein
MSSISFLHLASAGKKISTKVIVENIRKHYPDTYYRLASDAADDLSNIALINNCDYKYYNTKLGYPSYDSTKVLEWLERFKYACENCNTTHIMMVEDDVWIKKPITVHDDWQMVGFDIKDGNIIPEAIIDSIEEFSGKRPITNQYGCGGGAIFNVLTFLENYDKVTQWFKDNHDKFQKDYNPLGYMDCYMVVYYFLCGKDYSVNPYYTDTHHHTNDGYDYGAFVNQQPEHIEIVNNYKRYYWV